MLFPLYAHERSPHGLWKLAARTSVEGGMVGELVDTVDHLGEIQLYAGVHVHMNLVGLIDESSSAVHGRGVTGIGVPLAIGVTPETGMPTGPATHLASGKITMWLDPGTFVTDVWDTTDSILGADLATTPVGTKLSVDPAGTPGLLQADVNGLNCGSFVRKLVGGLGPVNDFDSYFIPRVQPLPEGRVFMVLRFKD